ncbi:hypothetical protein DAPPUDRAFT_326146 [Daphnia pulex]|uniref:Uncharacterized protein n=1 Tax=Daphnia pulex TaxID=6669 RepID=E9H6Z6_DAPPU|nr:hypothetical protein DAPPUDRAFT_326146 [Daphnia pulex]|eukprot:EFX72425.1 hypothetical protein DAPPUDRAFT_326146 [Daphnia pulex]
MSHIAPVSPTGKSRLLTDPEEIAQMDFKKKKKDMEKVNSQKTRADKPRLSNKENITENGKVVATKRNDNAVHEKEPLSFQNRQPRNAVHEKEPLSVQNRQPRNARKPAFLTQNYFFD